MPTQTEKTDAFKTLHQKGDPFIIANAFDAGSARILTGLGVKAIATTSSGFALTKGRKDYGVTRDEALAHYRELTAAVDVPVSADLENGWGSSPDHVATTITEAVATGLAGGSIEDATGDRAKPIFEESVALERINAAVEASRNSETGFVLTARAEAFLYSDANLDDVINRLIAFEEAGADVLFAPGLPDMDAVKAVCNAVAKPVNILVMGTLTNHSLEEFAQAGAARISIGGALAWQVYGHLHDLGTAIAGGDLSVTANKIPAAKSITGFLV